MGDQASGMTADDDPREPPMAMTIGPLKGKALLIRIDHGGPLPNDGPFERYGWAAAQRIAAQRERP